jgi:hypothetical protein
MSAIVRSVGIRIVISPNDHLPEHVHVLGPDLEAVVVISGPQLRKLIGGGEPDARKALSLVAKHLRTLLAAWRQFHG